MFAKLAWTEIKLGLREPTVMVFAIVFPLILLYLLLNSFGTLPDPDFAGVSPADYYVPAYAVGSVVATGLIALPVHLAAYRERGVLRRLREDEHVLTLGSGERSVRFRPALSVTVDELEQAAAALGRE